MRTENSRFINVERENRGIEEEQIWKECEEIWDFIKPTIHVFWGLCISLTLVTHLKFAQIIYCHYAAILSLHTILSFPLFKY